MCCWTLLDLGGDFLCKVRCQVAVISKSRRASTQTFHWSWRRLYACPMFLWSCLAGGGWEGGPRVPASCSDSLAEQQTGSWGSCLLLACLHNPQLLEDKAISQTCSPSSPPLPFAPFWISLCHLQEAKTKNWNREGSVLFHITWISCGCSATIPSNRTALTKQTTKKGKPNLRHLLKKGQNVMLRQDSQIFWLWGTSELRWFSTCQRESYDAHCLVNRYLYIIAGAQVLGKGIWKGSLFER